MKDWRTHCFDYIGGIANVAGDSLNVPYTPQHTGPDAAPAPAPAPAPTLTMTLSLVDPAKPTLTLRYTDASRTTPPGYWARPTPDMTFTPRKGAFKAGANAGEWEASFVLTTDVLSVEIKVFKSVNETFPKNFTALAAETIWFKPGATKGDAPIVMTTPPPELGGDLGVPYLDGAKFDALSEKRKKVIRDCLPKVAPSVVGTPAFDHLQTKAACETMTAEHAARVPPKRYTTCGTLTSFLSLEFAEPYRTNRSKIGGLTGCFWAAHDDGSHDPDKPAWVVAEAGLEPQPGDIFLITDLTTTPAYIKTMIPIQDKPEVQQHNNSTQTYNLEAFVSLHVGVIVDTSPGRTTAGGSSLWVVCEAGQGGDTQKCLYDPHVMSLDSNGHPLMSGRRLAGWVNIDNYTPWTV